MTEVNVANRHFGLDHWRGAPRAADPGPGRTNGRSRRRTIAALAAGTVAIGLTATWAGSAMATPATHAAAAAPAAVKAAAATTSGPITGYEGLCLDDKSAGTTNKNPVDVYTCNATAAQTWTSSGGNLLVLGKCLGPTGAGTANGTVVDIYDCNGTAAQLWQPQSNGELLNPNSGKCLDDTGSGGSGTPAQIWTCTDAANQKWVMPTGTGGGGGGGGTGLNPSVAPGGNFTLSQWELQLPTGSAGDPTTILPAQLEGDSGFTDSYFSTGTDGSMTF
ncbi:MAG TPA: ricin-type beta-trefoil lectin domain protein [Actinocrinis sp.]|nr:ricin-type beta-trefoil lectin domain protein [Actinocrinis sp.]